MDMIHEVYSGSNMQRWNRHSKIISDAFRAIKARFTVEEVALKAFATFSWYLPGWEFLHHTGRLTRIRICWDNFDHNQTVRRQTRREPAQHVSATTVKICIGHYMPSGDLRKYIFLPEIALDSTLLGTGESRRRCSFSKSDC
jgi:hypothetical protein